MEDVSRRIVNDMAACIKANVEAAESGPGGSAGGVTSVGGGTGSAASPAPMVTSKPINAVSLFVKVLWTRIRRALVAQPAQRPAPRICPGHEPALRPDLPLS